MQSNSQRLIRFGLTHCISKCWEIRNFGHLQTSIRCSSVLVRSLTRIPFGHVTRMPVSTTQRWTSQRGNDGGKSQKNEQSTEDPGIEEIDLTSEEKRSSVAVEMVQKPKPVPVPVSEQLQTSKFERIVSLARQSRMFEIDEFCAILRQLHTHDLCVIEIPKELVYADYLVIVSCRSTRALNACCSQMVKIFKHKQSLAMESESDVQDEAIESSQRIRITNTPKIEGEKRCRDWLAVDFGNIVLHAFLPGKRAAMDLESLWLFGERFDEASLRAESNAWATVDWLKILNDAAANRQKKSSKDSPTKAD